MVLVDKGASGLHKQINPSCLWRRGSGCSGGVSQGSLTCGVPKSPFIELGEEFQIPVLYEDRSVLALDKPAGWLVAPSTWDRAAQNLQRAIDSSIHGREFWVRSRNLKFLKFVHRLDAETSGVLLFVKSPGAMGTFSELFQSRTMEKVYLAVVDGDAAREEWRCTLPLSEDPARRGAMRVDERTGKESETCFRVLQRGQGQTLLEVRPLTGRTHQIRVHLAAEKLPIAGDLLYGKRLGKRGISEFPTGLRAIRLAYKDPFTRRPVAIQAPEREFVAAFGFRWEPPRKREEQVVQGEKPVAG